MRFVDGQIGHVLDALPPQVLADTVVVLTADHGEELDDHGWWKHGLTVYEEQLHVPLVVRWDRRLGAGRRLPEPVQLVDLVPTLLAAVGRSAPPEADGRDLLPLLAGTAHGEATAPRRTAFAQQLAGGPQRAALRMGDWKLALFDREARYQPENDLLATHYRVALDRLQRVELYNLADDPHERHDLASADPQVVERLAPLLVRQLDAEGRPGLRLALAAAPAGSRVAGMVRFARSPAGWESDFLAAGDRTELVGLELRFDWRAEGWPKGIRILGDAGVVEAFEASVDGEAVPPARLRIGEAPWNGLRVGPAGYTTPTWPPGSALALAARGDAGRAPVVALWQPAVRRVDDGRRRRDGGGDRPPPARAGLHSMRASHSRGSTDEPLPDPARQRRPRHRRQRPGPRSALRRRAAGLRRPAACSSPTPGRWCGCSSSPTARVPATSRTTRRATRRCAGARRRRWPARSASPAATTWRWRTAPSASTSTRRRRRSAAPW